MSEETSEGAIRVLVVYQGDLPVDIINALTPYTGNVIAVDIATDDPHRFMTDEIDCVVYDWRYIDCSRVGNIFIRWVALIPQLVLNDERRYFNLSYLREFMGAKDALVNIEGADLQVVIARFLRRLSVSA